MKKAFLFSVTLLYIQLLHAQLPEFSYHVKNRVVVTNIDNQLTRLSFILPLAKTNQYQTVSNVNTYGGVNVNIPETDDGYLRWTFTEDLPAVSQSKEIFYEFDVTVNPVNFDFTKVTSIHPYDTSSENYKWYTGASGAYVDPYNKVIKRTGNDLWSKSSDIIDYARKCYEHVATNYSYVNPFTGLHTLQDILNAGGGDCGNLSSVFISLLRHKNIPARHIVTVRPDGVYHVWADFYLEKYGWVPVDVTFKNSDPYGDYFGKFDGNGIVMSKDVYLLIDKGNGQKYYGDILQSYTMWYWATEGSRMNSKHQLISSRLSQKDDKNVVSEVSVQNPQFIEE